MATILQIPGSLSMAGNIQDIILDSAQTVNFKILLGAEVLLEENYDQDANNRIKIRLRDILPSLLSLSIPTDNVFEQTAAVKTFTFNVGGVTSNHTVVMGGVDASVDALTFLKANWLTWQLQQKRVKYADPEWLSYYATEAVAVKLKAYFKVGDAQTITLANFTAGKFYSLNVNFQYLSGLFETQPVYFDIWTEKAGPVRLSFIQRYVLMNDYYDSDDVFVFENSIGGIDTIRFTGEKEENNNFEISAALFDEDTLDYDIDFGRVYKKNTGYFSSDRERVWANEFFNSVNRYLVTADGLKRITVPEATGKFLHGDSASLNYEFNFALSKQTKFLNFARSETLPENVDIIDPDAEVFFLAPRLVDFPIALLSDLLIFPVQNPFSQEWRQLSYGAMKDAMLQEFITHIPASPDNIDQLAEMFEVVTVDGQAYVLCKKPFASVGEIQPFSGDGPVPGSLFDALPYATETAKGVIKIFADQFLMDNGFLKIKENVLTPAEHDHDTRYFTEEEVNALLAAKADLETGKVPASQLPSYVDDVLEYANVAAFPINGEAAKIYIALDTNQTYRWTGSGYAEISQSIAIGETPATAYRGDRGKIAYDHSQTQHNKALVGLGNVDNTSDLDKPISTATQQALNAKASNNNPFFSGKADIDDGKIIIDYDGPTNGAGIAAPEVAGWWSKLFGFFKKSDGSSFGGFGAEGNAANTVTAFWIGRTIDVISAWFNPEASVELFYNNAKRFETNQFGTMTNGVHEVTSLKIGDYTIEIEEGTGNLVVKYQGVVTESHSPAGYLKTKDDVEPKAL